MNLFKGNLAIPSTSLIDNVSSGRSAHTYLTVEVFCLAIRNTISLCILCTTEQLQLYTHTYTQYSDILNARETRLLYFFLKYYFKHRKHDDPQLFTLIPYVPVQCAQHDTHPHHFCHMLESTVHPSKLYQLLFNRFVCITFLSIPLRIYIQTIYI